MGKSAALLLGLAALAVVGVVLAGVLVPVLSWAVVGLAAASRRIGHALRGGGFTFIGVMIVLAILGIVTAVAVPFYQTAFTRQLPTAPDEIDTGAERTVTCRRGVEVVGAGSGGVSVRCLD